MKRFLLFTFLVIIFAAQFVMADMFVPEFDKMQLVRCEVSETMYNQDGSVVSETSYHRLLRFDDEYNLLYIQKEPVDRLLSYKQERVEYSQQSMTDDYMIYSNIVIDRINNEYQSQSRIIYDNPDFQPRYTKAEGSCKVLN